jgi:hypothetical protein
MSGGYAGTGQSTLLRQNHQIALFQQMTGIVGAASIAVQLERIRLAAPTSVAVQIYFTDAQGNSSSPGAFEVDIQTSDIDQDLQYCTAETWTGPLNGGNAGRVVLGPVFAKYVRIFVKSLANASVYTTAYLTSFAGAGSGSNGGGGGGGGGGPVLQVNGTPTADQALLNLVNGPNITIVDEGAGAVQISGTGSLSGNAPPFFRYFGDGSDGSWTDLVPAIGLFENWYTTFTLNAGVTLTAGSGGQYPMVIRATQKITIAGTITMPALRPFPMGLGGGTGGGGGGGAAAGTAGTFMGYAGSNAGTGGAAGGIGLVGAVGNTMPPNTLRFVLTTMGFPGSPASVTNTQIGAYGGTGGGQGGSSGGAGGGGGGAIFLIAPIIDFQSTAVINAPGAAGTAASGASIGGGGGGGGGLVILAAATFINQAGTINVQGGAGGASGGTGSGAGGAGGVGNFRFMTIS